MRAPLLPTLPLRKPADGAVALPLSIVVDMVRLGEGERILRVEDTLKVAGEDWSEMRDARCEMVINRLQSVAKRR